MVELLAAGRVEDIFGTGDAMLKAFAASRASEKVTARLYGGALHGETVWTPPEPVMCVCDPRVGAETFRVYTYELALGGADLEKWVAEYGHHPYQM